MNNTNAFQQFMAQMKGKDPNQIIQQMIQSGQVSQAQLNQAQQMAKQLEGQFADVRKMFGF